MSLRLMEEYRSREVVQALEELLAYCKTPGADVRSAIIAVQIGPHEHKIALAGGYRNRPADSFAAVLLLKRALMKDTPTKATG